MKKATAEVGKAGRVSRRTVLRGAGVALGLPWLEAMAASPEKDKGPVRMGAMYMPNGVLPSEWFPKSEGTGFELSPTLSPLADFRNDINVMSNLWNQGSVGGDGHYVKISGFLTSTTITKTLGVDISCNGVSMDQMAAKRLGHLTPLPSLELATAPVTTGVDKNVGYTRVYGSHIAWAGPAMPLAKEIQPLGAYERLFRATQPRHASMKQDLTLLDSVLDDARELRKGLGVADRQRVDEYLSVVRSLEERLQRTSAPGKSSWKARAVLDPAAKPPENPKNYAEHVELMLDMMAMAFQTDTTRIVTFMFGNEVSNQNFSFLDGVTAGFHDNSHHQKDAEKMRQYARINRWHMEMYARLLGKLKAMREGESNVLANSMLLIGSGIQDGDKHSPHNLPLVLAGQAGGRVKTGQHLVYSVDSPLSNLYVSMLDAFGAPVERFADSTGPLVGILA